MSTTGPMLVKMYREPGCPGGETVELTLENGEVFDLDAEECRQWFRLRGANMDVVENALDDCWNFWRSEVTIKNYRDIRVKRADDPTI
jgi:hypothetical protein